MKIHLEEMEGSRHPVIVLDEEPQVQRRNLLYDLLYDVQGSEDLYLAALDRAEAGKPELNWANNYVSAKMYPDGRVVIAQLDYLIEDDEKERPPQIVITIGEARKLILDWIEARDKWYADREAQRAAAGQSK